jgi:hypothetical protein
VISWSPLHHRFMSVELIASRRGIASSESLGFEAAAPADDKT